jgi:two-component system chemotaxis sensor kinase CheA
MAADDKLIRVFVNEASERLDLLEGLVVELEANPGGRELIDQFLAAAHTLKGSAGIVELVELPELAHAVETVMVRVRDGVLAPSAASFDRLDRALDAAREGVAAIGAGKPEPESVADARRALEAWLHDRGGDTPTRTVPASPAPEEAPLGEYDRVRIGVLERGGQALLRLQVPLRTGDRDEAAVAALVRGIRRHATVVTTWPRELDALVQSGVLNALVGSPDPTALADGLAADGLEGVGVERYVPPESRASSTSRLPAGVAADPTVSVELAVLDDVLRLVGELMITRDRYRQVATEVVTLLGNAELGGSIHDAAGRLGNLTADLQDAIMEARMIPVSRVFRAARRELRRRCRGGATPIEMATGGDATELDKTLVDALSQPLADFAAELGGRAAEAGDAVTVHMLAGRRWNNVVLRMTAGSAEAPAEAIDALRNELSPVGGRLDVDQLEGETTYVAALPLTLAIIRVMMARVGDEVYAFPIETVRETIELEPADVTFIEGRPVVDLRHEALSLFHLADYFDVPDARPAAASRVLVLDHSRTPIGVVVDALLGIREVVIKPLSARFARTPVLSGSAILGDERIAIILDADALVAEAVTRATRMDDHATQSPQPSEVSA